MRVLGGVLAGIFCALMLTSGVFAIQMEVCKGSANTTFIPYIMNTSEVFYTSNTALTGNIAFYYTPGMLKITVFGLDLGSGYSFPIYSSITSNFGNTTNPNWTTITGNHIEDLTVDVLAPLQVNTTQNTTPVYSCTKIKVNIVGQAATSKNLIIQTQDQDGTPIVAQVIVTDSNPKIDDQLFTTDTPWDGVGRFYISEKSQAPITLMASNTDKGPRCNGQQIITQLLGQQITESGSSSSGKTLVISGVQEETSTGSYVTGILKDSDGNLMPNGNQVVVIKDPQGTILKANTDANGQFRFYGGVMGMYNISATLESYIDAVGVQTKVLNPRQNLNIVFYNSVGSLTQGMPLTGGDQVTIRIYDQNQNPINTTIDGTYTLGGSTGGSNGPIHFTMGSGVAPTMQYTTTLALSSSGQLTISTPKTDLYNAASFSIPVNPGMDWMTVIVIVIVFLVIIVVAIAVLKSRGGGISRNFGDGTGGGPYDMGG